jgi:hypothetical protein
MVDFRDSMRRDWIQFADAEGEGALVDLLNCLAYRKRQEAVAVIFEEMEAVGQQRGDFIASFADKLDQCDKNLSAIYMDHETWQPMVNNCRKEVKKRDKADETIITLWVELLGQEWWIGLGCEKSPKHTGNWNKVRKFARVEQTVRHGTLDLFLDRPGMSVAACIQTKHGSTGRYRME